MASSSLSIKTFGIPIRIGYLAYYGFFCCGLGLPVADGGFIVNLLWWASFLGCCLLRELVHSLAARDYGIKTLAIDLNLLVESSLERRPQAPRQEFFIAAASALVFPVVAVVLGVSGVALESDFSFRLMKWIFLWGCWNLVPGFPMDGGRILRSLLAWKFSYLKATRIAVRVGQFAGIGVMIGAVSKGVWGDWGVFTSIIVGLLGILIWSSAGDEGKKVREDYAEMDFSA